MGESQNWWLVSQMPKLYTQGKLSVVPPKGKHQVDFYGKDTGNEILGTLRAKQEKGKNKPICWEGLFSISFSTSHST